MSMKNLAREVESIALALSEEGGYEYYHIDDELRELEKDVSDAQSENVKLRELAKRMARALGVGSNLCDRNCGWEFECDLETCPIEEAMHELGAEVDG